MSLFTRGLSLAAFLLMLAGCSSPAVEAIEAIKGGEAGELRVVTWNLEWFNDADRSDDPSELGRDMAAPDAALFRQRVVAVAAAIAALDPTLVALQEVENEKVVADLAAELRSRHARAFQVAFVPGRDSHTGQEVALLVRDTVQVRKERRFDFRPFVGRSGFKDLSKHLVVELTVGGEPLTVVIVHLITNPEDRRRQAHTLRAWIEPLVAKTNLIVTGDFNTGIRFNETRPESEMGILRGFGTPSRADDLFDVHERLASRATHVNGQEHDRMLLSPRLSDQIGLRFKKAETRRDLAVHGKVDSSRTVDYALPPAEQDLSDHFPLVVTLARP